MKVSRSKLGMVLAGGYLLLVVATVVWASVSAQTSPAVGGGPNVLAFLLTLPWSLLAVFALEMVRAGSLGSYLAFLIVLGISALINAAILYILGVLLGRVFSGTRRGT